MLLVSFNLNVNLLNVASDRPWEAFLVVVLLTAVGLPLVGLFGKKLDRAPAPADAHIETTRYFTSIDAKRFSRYALGAAISVVLVGSIAAGMFLGLAIIGYVGWARTVLWERTHDSIVVQQFDCEASQGDYYIKNSSITS